MIEDITKIIKAYSPESPEDMIRLVALTYMSQMLCYFRVSIPLQKGSESIYPNIFSVVIADSGVGKDRTSFLVKEQIFQPFDFEVTRQAEAHHARHNAEVEKYIAENSLEGSNAEKYRKENQSRSIANYSPRGGTEQGFFDMAMVMMEARMGAIMIRDSEFADTIISSKEDKQLLISYMKLAYDNGNIDGTLLRGSRDNRQVKRVPHTALLMTAPYRIQDNDGKRKFETILTTGYARRSHVCYPDFDDMDQVEALMERQEELIEEAQEIKEKIHNKIKKIIEKYTLDTNGVIRVSDEARSYFNKLKIKDLRAKRESKGTIDKIVNGETALKVLKTAGVIAAMELHDEILLEDIEKAEEITRLYNSQLLKMLNTGQESNEIKIANKLINTGLMYTTTQIKDVISMKTENKSLWLKREGWELVEEVLFEQGYLLVTEKYSRNGKKYGAKKIEEVDSSKVRMSVSRNNQGGAYTKDFEDIEVSFDSIPDLVNQDLGYSAARFENGHRKIEHAKKGLDLTILDIDEGWTIENCVDFLTRKGLKAWIITTRSHGKQKDSKPACDRFRVILQNNTPFMGTAEEYSQMMKNIFLYFDEVPDKSCKDISRFYWGNKEAETYYIEGNPLNILMFPTEQRQQYKPPRGENDNQEAIEKFFVKNATEGQRNAMLFRALKFAQDKGMNAREFVFNINSQLSNPLSEAELNKTIFKSL